MAETPGFKSKVSGRALYCGADNSRVVSNCELFLRCNIKTIDN
jgi:hypothetical protein